MLEVRELGGQMTDFETDKKPLTYLLDKIEQRELALPDFQRSFVWDAAATRELVVSVIRSFPAGTLLLLNGGAQVFAPRAFEEAPGLAGGTPSQLVLDGQQRLTSLCQAFSGTGTHRFFLNLQELLDGFDIDEATEVYLKNRLGTWKAIEGQANDLALPLARARDFATWRDEVLDIREEQGEDVKKLRAQLNELEKQYIKPIENYMFPVTTLSSSTDVEAVCTIFETLNRTGVKLSVFELLTARAFIHDERLRDRWDKAGNDFPILGDFSIDPYYVLQTIAMQVSKTPKRSAVIKIEIPSLIERWDTAVEGMAGALKMLRDECGVLVPKWIPYGTMLITLAAVWPSVSSVTGPAVGERRAKLRRWFWCTTFAALYDNAANSHTEQDVPTLRAWLEGSGPDPEAVADFRFEPTRWRQITPRQRALYRATVALSMADPHQHPMDFHDGTVLTTEIVNGRAVDDHHVFPRAYLSKIGRDEDPDTVLNHTLISKEANIRISGRAPSLYLADMNAELSESLLRSILDSHRLPAESSGPLFQDQYDAFLDFRQSQLEAALHTVTSE